MRGWILQIKQVRLFHYQDGLKDRPRLFYIHLLYIFLEKHNFSWNDFKQVGIFQ